MPTVANSIRPVQEEDAKGLLELYTSLDSETPFMMLEPGERSTVVQAQRERIQASLSKANDQVFVAESGGRLVGFVAALGGPYRRNRHSAHVVIGIRQDCCGAGLGTQLLSRLLEWSDSVGLRRLELTVMSHNERALALYRKMGFEVEGTKRDSLHVNGQYVDEYYMAKLLGSDIRDTVK